jgi:histidinol-phosphate phosphatase family protein
MTALDQAVVLCGGAGTRMAPLLGGTPKVLARAGDRSLLGHTVAALAAAGAKSVLLLAGPGGEGLLERTRAAARALGAGLEVDAIVEPSARGTAGALRGARERLRERFLLVYGDVFAAVDWRRLARAADRNGGLGTLVLHRSDHPEDSDLAAVDDAHRLTAWVGRRPEARRGALVARAALGNAGICVLHRDVLQRIPEGRACDLTEEIFPALVDARAPLHGYVTSEFVRDAGTPRRLEEVAARVQSGRAALRAELCLLDRDGVVVDGTTAPAAPDQVRLVDGAAAAVRALNEAGIAVALVSNQGGVARGLYDADALLHVHERVATLLAAEGARLDGAHYCPHHPETHWGDGDPELRGPCPCRKPSTAMVEAALERARDRDGAPIPPWRAVLVGDETCDLQAAMNAGLASIAVGTGHACRDGRYPARATWRFASLAAAAPWLCGAEVPEDEA